MKSNTLKTLCINLAKVESIDEAIALLKADGFWKGEGFWHPYGGNSNNASIIYNQAADSIRALVEKLTNGVDQLLILECLKRGIDPEGPDAPRSLKEAIKRFYKIPNGDISELTGKERSKLAKMIKLIATGTKSNSNFIISDQATGQSARTMPRTILSLAEGNKMRIPFTQGVYNQGGVATLAYSDLQLIISKQHTDARKQDDITSDNYCFTVVRLEQPKENEKLPVFTYLAPDKDQLFNFSADDLMINSSEAPSLYDQNLEYGTFIKLFDYKIKPKKLQSSFITTKLNFRISSLLPDIGLPVRVCERRSNNYKDQRDHNIIGLKNRLFDDPNNNLEGDPLYGELMIDGQKIPYTTFIFKKDAKVENYKENETLILSYNGQNMGTIDNRMFDSEKLKDLKNLKKSVLILADFSSISYQHRHKIFTPSRDRLRKDTAFFISFKDELLSRLSKESYLRELSNRRFNEEMKDRTKDNRDLEEIIKSVIKNDPILNDILGSGRSKIKSPLRDKNHNEVEKFQGVPYPTYFNAVKEFSRENPKQIKLLDHSFMLKFKTDAENKYFHRTIDPGNFILLMNGAPMMYHHFNLHNGKFVLHINEIKKHFDVNETVRFQWTVNDPSRVDPFHGEFYVNSIEGQTISGASVHKQKSPETLKMPNIKLIGKDKWDSDNQFDEDSALYINGGGDKRIFYINIDNKYLLNEIRKKPDSELTITKSWEVALALLGLTKLTSFKKHKSDYDVEQRIFEDMRDYCPILIPLVLRIAKLASYQKAA